MHTMQQARVFPTKKPFNRAQVYKSIKILANKITASRSQIDQIIATIDPEAGGAYYVAAELFKLLSARQTIQHSIDFLLVAGRRGKSREVKGVPRLDPSIKTILLVGDASFSGNTREITKAALQSSYPNIKILTATITAGDKKPDFFAFEVSEREVDFPWGLVDSTGECRTSLGLSSIPEGAKFGYRVWGNYEEFSLNQSCTARMLTVLRNQRLSLQVHFRRDELFVVLDKHTRFELGNVYQNDRELISSELEALVSTTEQGGKIIILTSGYEYRGYPYSPKVGNYVLVPRGTLHRLSAPKNTVRVVEISFGFYDQNEDIARMDDDYGRIGLSGRY